LTGVNFTTITWVQVPGAISYKIYRTLSGGTPATTGLIGTVTGGTTTSFNDTGIAGTTAVPAANTTGGGSFAGALQGTSATLSGTLAVTGTTSLNGAVTLGTASGTTGQLVFANSGNASLVSLQAGASSAAYALTLPTVAPTTGQCLQAGAVTAGLLVFSACSAGGVSLQGSTPGVAQTGHINITGTMIAGALQAASLDAAVSSTTLTIGGSNANAVSIGNGAAPTTVQGSLTGLTSLTLAANYSTASSTRLLVQGNMTSTITTQISGIQNQINIIPNGGSLSGNIYGLINVPSIGGSNYAIGTAAGAYSRIDTLVGYTGQLTNGIGIQSGPPSIAGTNKITNYMGIQVDANASNGGNTSGTINNYGLKVLGNTTAAGALGTLNNYSGYLQMSSAAGAGTTNNYGLYITGGAAGAGQFSIDNVSTAQSFFAGNILQQTTNNSSTAFQVQNAAGTPVLAIDTINQTLAVRAGSDTATLGGNLYTTNNFSADWSHSGWTVSPVTAATHTTTAAALLNTTVTPVAGNTYQVGFTISNTPTACGSAAQNIVVSMGGVSNIATLTGDNCSGTYSYTVTAVSGTRLAFTPTASWLGTISAVTIQQITGIVNSVLTVNNASGTASIEVRASSSQSNIFIGVGSGEFNSVGGGGVNNTALGTEALGSNTTGSTNTAIGTYSLMSNTTGYGNTGLGYATLQSNTTGTDNLAIGQQTLQGNTTGSYNTANGYAALYSNTTGSYNNANGFQALQFNTTGVNNTASGAWSLQSNTTGVQNNAVGVLSLGSNTTGNYNNAFGTDTLEYNTTGYSNSAFGDGTLQQNITGYSNSGFGNNALQGNTTGYRNNAVGDSALSVNTTGFWNEAIGSTALQHNTTGSANTAVGDGALQANTTGVSNTAVGNGALCLVTTGQYNEALGDGAGCNTSTGSWNVAIGDSSLMSNTTGSSNVALGSWAGYQDTNNVFATGSNLTYIAAIGADAQVQASNSIVLGSVDTPIKVGIGTTIPFNTFSVSPLDYSVGTAYQSTTTITGVGTTWTAAMVGDQFIFANGQTALITARASNTSLTASVSQTVSSTPGIAYRLHHIGLQVTSAGNVGIGTTAPGYALDVTAVAAVAANFNRSNDGVVMQFQSGGVTQGTISIAGATTSYNAFTGSHYAHITSGTLERGMLAALTGTSDYAPGAAEPIYGIVKSQTADQPNILGAYLAPLNPGSPYSTDNPELVMAAGNGDIWIADNGTGNVQIGDPLISSSLPGYAMRDPKTFAISHVFAKVAEPIDWSTVTTTVNGVKVAKVTGLFSFYDSDNTNGHLQGGSLDLAGSASISGNLNVSGATTLTSLEVTGSSLLDGGLVVKGSVNLEGSLTVMGITNVMDITVNGHIVTAGDTPIVTAMTAAGSNATVTIVGNDISGTITVVTGDPAKGNDPAPSIGQLAKIVFAKAYGKTPQVDLTPGDTGAADLRWWRAAATDSFSLNVNATPAANTSYSFDYFVRE
jgi:hypothetical protein